MSPALKVFRSLFWCAVGVYFIAGLAVLGLRYAVLPRIDSWRPDIEAAASRMLDAPVRIASIAADWRGLHPRLRFDGLRIDDDSGQAVLVVPKAAATLSWRSVLMLEPRLLSLEVSGLDLTVRRDAQGGIWVAGRSLSGGGGDPPGSGSRGLRWLLEQRELAMRGGTLRWQDESRQAPELILSDASLLLRNGPLRSRLAVSASPPAAYASGISFRAELARNLLARDRALPAAWSGQAYAQLDDAEPGAWRPWLDMPEMQGRMGARAWMDIEAGKVVSATADVAVRGLDWTYAGPAGTRVGAEQLTMRVEGTPRDLIAGTRMPFAAATSDHRGVSAKVQAAGVSLHLPGLFDTPELPLQTMALDFTVDRPAQGPWTVLLRDVAVANADLSARLQGVWSSEGRTPAGTLDLQGQIERAEMNAIHRYLPRDINRDAREWLGTGLVAGQAQGVAVTVRGDLGDFPFDADPSRGQFRVAGTFRDALVDYVPAEDGRKGWPRLEQLSGSFEIERVALRLRTQGGQARTGESTQVELGQVSAEIPDMERNATLRIQGTTEGEADAYLAMMRNSPLGALLDHAFDEARGSGKWAVPLNLVVPLLDAEETQVRGSVRFADATLDIMPGLPAFSGLNGELAFSEQGVSASDLRGRFLGGPVRVSGDLSRKGAGLRFDGVLAATALHGQWPMPAMKRFSGKTGYTARLSWRLPDSVDLSVESDLKGLGIDLPAPLGKSAQAAMPVKALWGPGRDKAAPGRWLEVAVEGAADLLLEVNPAAGGTYFRRGGLGLGREAPVPSAGLAIAAQLPELDAVAWKAAGDAFVLPAGHAGRPGRPLLPDVTAFQFVGGLLHTSFMSLRDVNLDMAQQAPRQWRMDLRSREATGTVSWQEATDKAAGKVSGNFEHLALGEAGEAGQGSDDVRFDDDQLSDIPAVDLKVKRLALYGLDVGALELSGVNVERGRRWRIDTLKLTSESATLDGTGMWQLQGEERGLELDMAMAVSDLGGLVTRLGMPDRVVGGHGKVQGKLAWRNVPWRFRYIDLAGTLDVHLEKGTFPHVSSRSARLLELLSLQSVERLAKLEFNPGAAFRDGFRFDTIRSQMRITQGVVHTEGVKIDGPVAAIVLAGDTNLTSETWNLEAAVVPKLDASGAAIAAGVAVNPLVGLGALLTQWILKEPLARAMTSRYAVTGTWDEPKLAPIHGEGAASRERGQAEEPLEH